MFNKLAIDRPTQPQTSFSKQVFRTPLAYILQSIAESICNRSHHPSAAIWFEGRRSREASSIRRTPPGCWRVRPSSVSHQPRRGFPSLPPRRARRDRRTPQAVSVLAPFFGLFLFFSVLQKTMKKRMVRKSTFSANFDDFWASGVDF